MPQSISRFQWIAYTSIVVGVLTILMGFLDVIPRPEQTLKPLVRLAATLFVIFAITNKILGSIARLIFLLFTTIFIYILIATFSEKYSSDPYQAISMLTQISLLALAALYLTTKEAEAWFEPEKKATDESSDFDFPQSEYGWYGKTKETSQMAGFFIDVNNKILFWPTKSAVGYQISEDTAAKIIEVSNPPLRWWGIALIFLTFLWLTIGSRVIAYYLHSNSIFDFEPFNMFLLVCMGNLLIFSIVYYYFSKFKYRYFILP